MSLWRKIAFKWRTRGSLISLSEAASIFWSVIHSTLVSMQSPIPWLKLPLQNFYIFTSFDFYKTFSFSFDHIGNKFSFVDEEHNEIPCRVLKRVPRTRTHIAFDRWGWSWSAKAITSLHRFFYDLSRSSIKNNNGLESDAGGVMRKRTPIKIVRDRVFICEGTVKVHRLLS
jgi:hypothetical protein